MQTSHLKKIERTDILSTLRSFEVGESEFIPFSESQVETNTWRARYDILRRTGVIDGKFVIHASKNGMPTGTLIMRAM